MTEPAIDFRTSFNALPGNFFILKPDAPFYTILAVSDELLRITSRERKGVVGKSVFEVYPENPEAVPATGPSMLRTSIQNALKYKRHDQMPTVRYDVLTASGVFEEKYWSASNKPVIDSEGEVIYIIHSTMDLTEQVLSQQKANENEQQLDSLIENAPFPIAVYTGREMRIHFANQAMIDAYGKGNDVIGSLLANVLPEMDPEIYQRLDEVFTSGVPFQAKNEFIEILVNGKLQPFYYNYSFTPLFDSQGKVYGVMSSAADVTELNFAHKKLEESESRFRHMIEQAPVAIGLTRGRDHLIESMNAPMMRILGKEHREEVEGKNLAELIPEMKNQPILKVLQDVLETGEAFSGKEVQISLMPGKKLKQHYFNVSYTPLIEEGNVTGLIHLAVDVTEQVTSREAIEKNQEALKRFKFMADQARDAFVLMREDGSFAYLNQKALEAWGYPEEEAQHIKVPDVDPIYQKELFIQLFYRAQQETIPVFETLHRRKDGEIFPVEVTVAGLKLEGQAYLFAVARDISERKKAEETLKLKNEQLLRINNDLDNFIYTASHDLKAPITNVEGLIQLLLRNLPAEVLEKERVQQITQMMQESVERFKKTIGSLTDVVKLQKEHSGEAVSVDLAAVIKEVQLDLEPMIREFGVQLEIDIAPGPFIRFPEKNLRSVVYNLLSNAIKYRSSKRLPRVEISWKSSREYDVLAVRDNGIGIRERSLSQLFTMFKRFHTHVEGAGIGLYMVKKMVENAGGHVEVESLEGEGTTFRVYFLH